MVNSVKLLIVDDSETIRATLKFIFTRKKFLVEVAADGREALRKVAVSRPDIILLDGAMPVMDGIETCQRLKEDPETMNIPVIFCSATQVGKAKEAEIKADDYIEKPFTIDALYDKIQKTLKKRDIR